MHETAQWCSSGAVVDGQCTGFEEIYTMAALAKVRSQEIYNMYRDCRKGGAAGEQAAPRQQWCKRESGVVLRRCCCMWFIYRQLPAESGRDGTRVWGER